MDLSRYRHLYVSETQENLDKLSRLLVEVESQPSNRSAVDTLFRLVHSIKGMSGTMGYSPVFELAHGLEDLLDHFRSTRVPLTPSAVDALLAGLDRIGQWVADVDAERLPLSLDAAARAIADRARRALTELKGASGGPSQPLSSAADEVRVEVQLTPTVTDPALRALLAWRRLTEIGQVRSVSPPLSALRSGRLEQPLSVVVATRWSPEDLRAWLRLMPEVVEVTAARAAAVVEEDALDLTFSSDLAPPSTEKSLWSAEPINRPARPVSRPLPRMTIEIPARPRIDADDFDALAFVAEPPPVEPQPAEPQPIAPAPVEPPPVLDAAVVKTSRSARAVRVRTDWLDGVLSRTADLRLIAQRLWSLERTRDDPALASAVADLSRVINALHADALDVRMTPLSILTSRLPRVVRDLARQVGKHAQLALNGDDLALDRAIIEGLDAPLTHLVTNAIEHGIETPEERVQRGKAPHGTLTLRCARERDELVLDLEDDGRGVDVAHLAQRAEALGLLDRARAESLGRNDLVRLLCMPGLTTRETPGDNSGRGVGLDAVYESVQALGGLIEVTTELGVGTRVRLRLPRTPGITRVLLVEAGGRTWGVPLGRVITTAHVEAQPMAAGAPPSAIWDGASRRAYDLHTLTEGRAHAPSSQRFLGVVHAADDGPFIVAVDRVIGQQDAVLRPLGPLLERVDGLFGVTLDTQGQPLFLLDLPKAVSKARSDAP